MSNALPYVIEPWRRGHDTTEFSCGVESLDRYIKQQVSWDMSSKTSLVFVLTESGSNVVRAFYSLSSAGILLVDLPEKVQKKLPRYPQISATLLGRLGVDANYSAQVLKRTGKKARLGELMLLDAQRKLLQGANTTAGSSLLVVDVLSPSADEIKTGVRDPMKFYTQFGFLPLPGNDRRLYKLTRQIEAELASS